MRFLIHFQLQFLHFRRLILRQDFGEDPVNSESVADTFRRSSVIAGDHHHLQTQTVHLSDGFLGTGFDGIRHSNQSGGFAINSNPNYTFRVRLQLFSFGLQAVEINIMLIHHFEIAQDDLMPLDLSDNAMSS